MPARFGVAGALRLAAACHLGMVVLLVLLPWVYPSVRLDLWASAWRPSRRCLVYEHWLVRPDDLTRVNVAFFQVNAVVSIGPVRGGGIGLARLGQAVTLKRLTAAKMHG